MSTSRQVAGPRPRVELMAECDLLVLPKPLAEVHGAVGDRTAFRLRPSPRTRSTAAAGLSPGRLCITGLRYGRFGLHAFRKNDELAGYCSVIHALQLIGTTAAYGRQALVVSFGATPRGAGTALLALGVHDITLLTHRSVPTVAAPRPPARLVHYQRP